MACRITYGGHNGNVLDTSCHWLSFEVHFAVIISSVLSLLVTIAVASMLLEPEFVTRHLLSEDSTLQSNPRVYFSALYCPITCSRRAENDRKTRRAFGRKADRAWSYAAVWSSQMLASPRDDA